MRECMYVFIEGQIATQVFKPLKIRPLSGRLLSKLQLQNNYYSHDDQYCHHPFIPSRKNRRSLPKCGFAMVDTIKRQYFFSIRAPWAKLLYGSTLQVRAEK